MSRKRGYVRWTPDELTKLVAYFGHKPRVTITVGDVREAQAVLLPKNRHRPFDSWAQLTELDERLRARPKPRSMARLQEAAPAAGASGGGVLERLVLAVERMTAAQEGLAHVLREVAPLIDVLREVETGRADDREGRGEPGVAP